jgi:hypothetical protein
MFADHAAYRRCSATAAANLGLFLLAVQASAQVVNTPVPPEES